MWEWWDIEKIELLPDTMLQIDLVSGDKTNRIFISLWLFFDKFQEATHKWQDSFYMFRQMWDFQRHLKWEIDIVADDSCERETDENIKKELKKLVKESWINYEKWKFYLTWDE